MGIDPIEQDKNKDFCSGYIYEADEIRTHGHGDDAILEYSETLYRMFTLHRLGLTNNRGQELENPLALVRYIIRKIRSIFLKPASLVVLDSNFHFAPIDPGFAPGFGCCFGLSRFLSRIVVSCAPWAVLTQVII
jgi:hypothetical protein